jgi:ABC-type uncharacterized transport system fused permease/ATPase subunit
LCLSQVDIEPLIQMRRQGQLRPQPSDVELEDALRRVRLEALLDRSTPPSTSTSAFTGSTAAAGSGSNGAGPVTGLDCMVDWAGILSLGEQQRLAFAR